MPRPAGRGGKGHQVKMAPSSMRSLIPTVPPPPGRRPAASPHQTGFTLVEMMIAVTIFSVVAIALLQHLTISYSSSRMHRERVYAYTKAQAILAEMHALVDSGATTAAIDSWRILKADLGSTK